MPRDDRLIIELPRNGNLDVVLRMFISTLGAGLQAIAVALSTPHDNSAEVKAYAERIKKQVGALDAAAQTPNRSDAGD